MIKYKDGLILTQESIREPLDQDPSEGQNWNWEDYERSTAVGELHHRRNQSKDDSTRKENDESRGI